MERLIVAHLSNIEELNGFSCGVEQMDNFVQNGGLAQSLLNNYCQAFTVRNEADVVVAFFALAFDSLRLDADDREDLLNGWAETSTPQPTAEYIETFWSKVHYPALEIAYLAVDKRYQGQHIGKYIIQCIEHKAHTQELAGCQFLTVGALVTKEYSAVGFYRACDFAKLDVVPTNDVLRMYHNLLTK